MKEIRIEELRYLELQILKDVAEFCEKNNLKYFLCGGTLIGVIRHKGFIPWDDDIDIAMPRPDYEKFIRTYKSESGIYKAFSHAVEKDYWRTHCQVFDQRTVMEEDTFTDIAKQNAVFLDVFPIDGVPSSKMVRRLYWWGYLLLHAMHYGAVLKYKKSNYYGNGSNIKNKFRTFIKSFFIFIFRWFDYRKIIALCDNYAKMYKYDDCKFVSLVAEYGDWGERGVVPKSIYEKSIKADFEDGKYHIAEGYDIYLKNVFGDYMQLPPECDRVNKHWFKAYWKE